MNEIPRQPGAAERHDGAAVTAKAHYDNHLARFYAWMCGDFEQHVRNFQLILGQNGICPRSTGFALDLGAGHGVQSVALTRAGFRVAAIDLSDELLRAIESHPEGKDIATFRADIRNVPNGLPAAPEVIVSWGDTLTHLDNVAEVTDFIRNCAGLLAEGGIIALSWFLIATTRLSRTEPNATFR